MKKIFIIPFIAFFVQYNSVLADNTTFNKYYAKYKNEAENQYYSDVQEIAKTCGNYEMAINTFRSFLNEVLLQEKLKQENQLVFKIHLSCLKFINFTIADIINQEPAVIETINLELKPLLKDKDLEESTKKLIEEATFYKTAPVEYINN